MQSTGMPYVNVYAIADGDGLLLVDGGWACAEATEELCRALASIGAGPADIRRIVVTHHHRDHYTNAVALRRDYGMPIAVGEPELASIAAAGQADVARTAGIRARLAWADTPEELLRALDEQLAPSMIDRENFQPPDLLLTDGQTLELADRRIVAVWTPGHTRGHFAFVDRLAGLLFAGDHVLPGVTPAVGFDAHPANLGLRSYQNSLRMMLDMPDMMVLPAHGPPSVRSHDRVAEILEHHQHRLAAVVDAIAAGDTSVFEVASRLPWRRRGIKFGELPETQQILAAIETEMHLNLLVDDGVLTVGEVDGVGRYSYSQIEHVHSH
jgi:glyoxylase-like metal-dependent hydrolase (beta-lactamase superfamily II)